MSAAPSSNGKIETSVRMLGVIANAIRDAGKIANGELYADVMGFLNITQYAKLIDILKRSGLIEVEAYMLTWIGPKK